MAQAVYIKISMASDKQLLESKAEKDQSWAELYEMVTIK